jgi:Rrf2 family transcriptional regulator, nitric oxide-sensitive transcriptional repressor
VRLTRFSDNALRCLIALAVQEGTPATTEQIARQMAMSTDHLVKVVSRLAALGLVETLRGRRGGIRLARPAAEINVGAVVRATEDNLALVECFHPTDNDCPIAPACGLAPALSEALTAFFTVLDRYTLADLVGRRRELFSLMRA